MEGTQTGDALQEIGSIRYFAQSRFVGDHRSYTGMKLTEFPRPINYFC